MSRRTDNDALNYIQCAGGSYPVTTGAGVKVVNCYAFEAWEDTVIASFRDNYGATIVTGWETITIKEGKTIFFSTNIKDFTVTSGGLGQIFRL